MSTPVLPGFCDPELIPIVRWKGQRRYQTPDGYFPGPTTVIGETLGLGKQGLIRWSANEERRACLAAAQAVYDRLTADGLYYPDKGFTLAVEELIGPQREHQRKLKQGSDIGEQAHKRIQWVTRQRLGLSVGAEPLLSDEAQWAFMAWEDWDRKSGLTAIACEQPVWDPELRTAGTLDNVSKDALGRLGIVDYKTSKSVYPDHHIQLAAYCHMARRFVPIEWAKLVHLPKNVEDPGFEVYELGEMVEWDYRLQKAVPAGVLTEEALLEAYRGALTVWETFCEAT